jgi:hypothetical protein
MRAFEKTASGRQKGLSVGFYTAAALVHELLEARDEKRLLRLQRQLAGYKLLIIDELGYVPLSQTGAELLFEVFSQRYERGSTVVTSNLPFDEWTSVFGSERLTGALLDRLTHHVHILEMNGDSYRLNQSKRRCQHHRCIFSPANRCNFTPALTASGPHGAMGQKRPSPAHCPTWRVSTIQFGRLTNSVKFRAEYFRFGDPE